MKRMKWYWLAVIALAAAPSLAAAGNINVFLGGKTLSNDWAPYEEQGEFGILMDFGDEYWPVSFAIDLLGSAHTKSDYYGDYTVSTSELDFGVRKAFGLQGTNIHPYVGGGLGIMSARYEEQYYYGTYSVEDSALGIWLNGGVYVTLGQSFNLGLDLRYSQADVTILGTEVDAGGTHAGLLLGYHW